MEVKWKDTDGEQGTVTKGQKIISGMKIWTKGTPTLQRLATLLTNKAGTATNIITITLQDGYPTELNNSVLFPLPGYTSMVSKTLIKLL